MARAPRSTKSVVYGAKPASADKSSRSRKLREADMGSLHGSRSARLLATIRRDMDLKGAVMTRRLRNEQVLALAYRDGTMLGGARDTDNLRENALNLPYRQVRWVESQATSKRMELTVSRDAGAGQRPSGPDDADTGLWTGITLGRVAYEGGLERELKAVIGEVLPRGTSVMAIGYHEEVITLSESMEVGKDAQSVIPEVLTAAADLEAQRPTSDDALEAKPGQAHSEIAAGLANMAQDPLLQTTIGRVGVAAILERKASHDQAEFEAESRDIPKESTRLIRHKVWLRKKRVGEDVGWSPHVYDIEDAPMMWDRHVWTVAEVKVSPLFTASFKEKVKGYDARNVSGVASGAQTSSTQSMGSDAMHAQGEDVLDDDERMVEWFAVWFRRPDMKSGGVRKIVCAETPDEFIEQDESNPHVDSRTGFGLIPGFFPFYDFTPILPSLTVPERTCGTPPIAVGMTQFEQIAELYRLLHESALRHSLRLYQGHPALKANKKLKDAIENGQDGYFFFAEQAQMSMDGRIEPGVVPIQFSGNTLDIERLVARLEGNWVKVTGMPPSVLQGMGTAETASQDNMGLAAGERESGALISYFEHRLGDVLSGVRGLIRGNYDDEDFQVLLGQEGAAVMKAWQEGTADDGDTIEVAFGANAQAERTVRTKQVMEAITLQKAEVEPITGLPKYDSSALFEELNRLLGVGKPKIDATPMRKLEDAVLFLSQQVKAMSGMQPGAGQGPSGGGKPMNGKPPPAGPNPSEGDGPQEGTLAAGARRGTSSASAGM